MKNKKECKSIHHFYKKSKSELINNIKSVTKIIFQIKHQMKEIKRQIQKNKIKAMKIKLKKRNG